MERLPKDDDYGNLYKYSVPYGVEILREWSWKFINMISYLFSNHSKELKYIYLEMITCEQKLKKKKARL